MSSTFPAEPVRLTTGPLSAILIDGALRDVRIGGHRALDAVYAAVRDPDWGTIPGEITAFDLAQVADGIAVRFTVRHGTGFEWRGRIDGRAGQVTFDFDGEFLTDMAANRVGFCLLHPIELAGRPVLARTEGGDQAGRFPDRISPHQPFLDLVGLRYDVATGVRVELSFAGDLFEMEDHRNWTDAGFKTYCTPLRRPSPVRYRAGDRVRQRIRIAAHVEGTTIAPVPAAPRIIVGDVLSTPFPDVGCVYAEIDASTLDGGSTADLKRAASAGAGLDVALIAPAGTPADRLAAPLVEFADRLARVSVFDAESGTTPPGMAGPLRDALRRLGVGAPVGGGALANFAELNRMRLDADELDFVTYRINPRVHHDDPDLVMDTLMAQPHTVRDARAIGAGRPVVVRLASPGGGDDFAAAWTIGSLAALSGAAAVTFPVGDPGVDRVLAAVTGLAGAPVRAVDAPSRTVAAMAVGSLLLVANLRAGECVVDVAGRPVELGPYEVVRHELG